MVEFVTCDGSGGVCSSCGHPLPAAGVVRACGGPSHRPVRAIGYGPGTELKKLLASVGITASPDCSCNRVADEMDAWGPDECERPERLAYVLAAMRENAARRGLPFVEAAARFLVKRAIRNARRNLPRIGPSGQS